MGDPFVFNPFEQPKEDVENYFSPLNQTESKMPELSCSDKAGLILAFYGQRSDIPLDSEFWELVARRNADKSCGDIVVNLASVETRRTEAETILFQANAILNAENGKMSNIAYRDVYWALMNRYRSLIRES